MDRLWAMQIFVRVAECGSFSRAAASLDLANATVTSCLRNLESHLGATLINRNTRFLRLTDAGEQFLIDSRQILQAVEQAEGNVHATLRKLHGTLKVDAPIAFGQALLCPALSEFAKQHPGLTVEVTLTNQPRSLIENAIDIAVRMSQVEDVGLVARPIYEGRYVICGLPSVIGELAAHPAKLDPRTCLGLSDEGGRGARAWRLHREGVEVIIKPDGPLHFNSSRALIDVALRGGGLVHVLDVYVESYLLSGGLAVAYPDWNTATKPFYAVTPKARGMSHKIRTLIDFLLDALDSRHRPPAWHSIHVGPTDSRRPSARA